MKKIGRYIIVLNLLLGLSGGLNAQDLLTHDFNDGTLGGFEPCTTKSPNYAKVVNNRLETYWTESGYDGGRVSKGAEACGKGEYTTRKEGWMGMYLNVDNSYPRDKESGILQIFGFANDANVFTWEGMLKLWDGDLTLVHRVRGTGTEEMVYSNFPYGEDVSVIVHFILSANNNGEIEVWVNGNSEFRITGINFGLGNFNSNDEQYDDTYTELKMGQYNYDNNEYTDNEVRIVSFDNVSWYNGADGYNIVDPTGGSGGGGGGQFVSLQKSNSDTFAIDGNYGGANAQNVYLWSYVSNNENQQWEEISRGSGYYSYRKSGTNYCLDGGRGGANGQSVYLWTCGDTNHNQHWKKVSISGRYRLEKRNAPAFSIDGGRGGANAQDVYLWSSSNINQNQQWIFSAH